MAERNRVVGDLVSVREHPTVVRLADLDRTDAAWLSESFVSTPEIRAPLTALRNLLGRPEGAGAFLIGHYGSGKTHLLAYLAQQVRAGGFVDPAPRIVPISLVNHRAENRLEDVIAAALGVDPTVADRRAAWQAVESAGEDAGGGTLLLLDELSEFLRSKADSRAFNEDVRFLQYIGEWARDRRFWVIAAMQESIEHTGELEYALYRKIKDRYPLRLRLSPAHVEALVADGILLKRPGFERAMDDVVRGVRAAFPGLRVDPKRLAAVYPLHPATLELLEAVRDRFSQARGVVDFVVGQLRGDPSRARPPFLDAPWGTFVTPERIVDHFRDLFELEPEFLAIAQQLFPWYEHHLEEIFDTDAARELAERLLKLLVLLSLTPQRESLDPDAAAQWLFFAPSRIDPERNRAVVARTLATLATRGRYVTQSDGGYRIDLADDGAAAFESSVARAIAELQATPELVLESVLALLPRHGFNPFLLERDLWQHRRVRWHFHERRFAVWLGDGDPGRLEGGFGLVLRLPWGEQRPAHGIATLVPRRIEVDDDLTELAALSRLAERSLSPTSAKRLGARMERLVPQLQRAVRAAWLDARLVGPDGRDERAPRVEGDPEVEAWLAPIAIALLRRTFPGFERFAPTHGPLPREAWRRFLAHGLGGAEVWGHDEQVELVYEGYLVPMGLVRRARGEYVSAPGIERHELVRLIWPILEHGPAPGALYEHLAQPIHGLVADQVSALLLHLTAQGLIDIRKGDRSLREAYETLSDPRGYDQVVEARGLTVEQRDALTRLAGELGISAPKRWSGPAERRIAGEIAGLAGLRRTHLEPILAKLRSIESGGPLATRLESHLARWRQLEGGPDPLAGFELFLRDVGSITAFTEEARELLTLAERLPSLLADIERFRHLLRHPVLAAGGVALESLTDALELFAAMPALVRLDDLVAWLDGLAGRYERYKRRYRAEHDAWWQEVSAHPLWGWRAPVLASSRHAGLEEALVAVDAARAEAERARCRIPSNLDYQPLCACGYDGNRAPVLERLEAGGEHIAALEARLRAFFAEADVRRRVLAWRDAGLEANTGTLAYLEHRAPWPDIVDVASFDQHLAGLDLVQEIDESVVTEVLASRAWTPEELLAHLRGSLEPHLGRRLRFRPRAGPERFPPVAAEWMARQAAHYGEALPVGLDGAARAAIGESLRSEWFTAQSLLRLERVGLRGEDEDRVCGWLIDGTLPVPDDPAPDSLAGVVHGLLDPARFDSPDALARATRAAYRVDHRLHRLAGPRWIARLEALATNPLPALPSLVERLNENVASQWLVVDCAGLAVAEVVERTLVEALAAWQLAEREHAFVARSSTDAFYRALLDAGINHPLEKVNVVDELVHESRPVFADLEARIGVELALACRPLSERLDPGREVLVFADHGFRLSPNRQRFVHGGDSTLERVTPLWRFASRGGRGARENL